MRVDECFRNARGNPKSNIILVDGGTRVEKTPMETLSCLYSHKLQMTAIGLAIKFPRSTLNLLISILP
jgi:hypothetical protein